MISGCAAEDVIGVVLHPLRRCSFPPAVARRSPARGKAGRGLPAESFRRAGGAGRLLASAPAGGIASEAHTRNGRAKGRGRPYGGKFMRRRRSWKRGPERRGLFQPCVFRLRLLQHGNIGVGVFPEREEILIGRPSFGCVSFHGVSTPQSQPGQRTPTATSIKAAGTRTFQSFLPATET